MAMEEVTEVAEVGILGGGDGEVRSKRGRRNDEGEVYGCRTYDYG